MKVASMFSGIGGIDLGFQQAGFDVIWANEFDKDAATTYRLNFGEDHLVEGDIRSVDPSDIPDFDPAPAKEYSCGPSLLRLQKYGNHSDDKHPHGSKPWG